MVQLKFDDKFSKIIDDILFWKDEKDIPKHIKDYIKNVSDNRIFFETSSNKFYCGKCVSPLNENYICVNCGFIHKGFNNLNMTPNKNISILDKISCNYKFFLDLTLNYFVFNIDNGNVFLYFINEEITYDNPFYQNYYKSSKLSIDLSKSYLILKDGVINLKNFEFISFEYLDYCYKKCEENNYDIDSSYFKTFEIFNMEEFNTYVYTENLEELKKTAYKYSKLWNIKDFIVEQESYSIASLIFYPVYYKQFEYLLNYNLINLAWNVSDKFQKFGSFQEMFGVSKKLLPFMAENNINWTELKLLQLYPTEDYGLLKFYTPYYFELSYYKILENTKIDLKVLKDYLIKNDLEKFINEYFDYIIMAKELNLDLDNKDVLYPENLREAHDNLYLQIEIIEDPIIDEKIKKMYNILLFNKYEDENYVIYPVSSISELIEESRQQKNCVRTYCDKIANKECQIYFMRDKNNLNTSFVTIEVRNNKVVQAKTKYNESPPEEIIKILNKWEQNLLQISIDK